MIPGWKEELEGEYLKFLQECRNAAPADFAARFGVSECCVIYWLTDLARNGRIRIRAFELVEKGETPCAPQTALTCQRVAFCPASKEAPVVGERG